MDRPPTIEDLRSKHESLYQFALEKGKVLLPGSPEYDAFERETADLLQEIQNAAATVATFEEYRWLLDAAVKWQVVFSSILGNPRTITIPKPAKVLLPPTSATLTKEEVEHLLDRLGLGVESAQHTAETFLASDILDGRLNFASRVAPRVYPLLERVWLYEVKALRAYFLWRNRGDGISTDAQYHADYLKACGHLNCMLINRGIKALPAEFAEARDYLESRYLSNGRLDLTKPAAVRLIDEKAYRIWERTGRRHGDDLKHHHDALGYTRLFYEHIVGAVERDEVEDVRMVLKAFQFSKELHFGYYVVNSFEAVLATYFLNPNTVKKLWDDADTVGPQLSAVVSSVNAPWWPSTLQVPSECSSQFSHSLGKIQFTGVMSEAQEKAFLCALKDTLGSQNDALQTCREAIEDLAIRSRLVQRETTL